MRTVAVIGAGQMGTGVAQTVAQFGMKVLLADVDLVVLNEIELAVFSAAAAREAGADGIRFARPVDAAMVLLEGRCQAVIVTLGAEGAWLVTGEDAVHFPAPVVTVVDTTAPSIATAEAAAQVVAAWRRTGSLIALKLA